MNALAAEKTTSTVQPPPSFYSTANLSSHAQKTMGETCSAKKWKSDGHWQFVSKEYTAKHATTWSITCHLIALNFREINKWKGRTRCERYGIQVTVSTSREYFYVKWLNETDYDVWTPGCANPSNGREDTEYLESAASGKRFQSIKYD